MVRLDRVSRRTLIGGAAALAGAAGGSGAWAQESFSSQGVSAGRATVPVRIDGHGPFQFLVDTAANASVLAADLAERLALPSMGPIGIHTLVGREVVPTVRAATVHSGALEAANVRMAIGQRAAIGGLDGLLGCDLLAESRIVLSFAGSQRIRIGRSAPPARSFTHGLGETGQMVAAGERRFGNLLAITARAGSTPTTAIIDSGAEGTLLNTAAARAARCLPIQLANGSTRVQIHSPTGEVTLAQPMLLRELGFAGIDVTNLPVAVGDFHTFGLWGLQDQPAMLIGLDILRLFKRVYIDLKRSEFSVYL